MLKTLFWQPRAQAGVPQNTNVVCPKMSKFAEYNMVLHDWPIPSSDTSIPAMCMSQEYSEHDNRQGQFASDEYGDSTPTLALQGSPQIMKCVSKSVFPESRVRQDTETSDTESSDAVDSDNLGHMSELKSMFATIVERTTQAVC